MEENFNELKKRAAEYYHNNKVPEKLETILNQMFYEDPKDVNGRLAEYFESFSLSPTIFDLKCKRILSTSGKVALKCQLCAVIKNRNKVLGSSQLSLQSEINHFQEEVYDGDVEPPTVDDIFEKNKKNINEIFTDKLKGISLLNQREVDYVISDCLNEWERNCATKLVVGDPDIDGSITPTPSSGKKKKPPTPKGKVGKPSDKPVPPKEAPEHRPLGFSSSLITSAAVLKSSALFLQRPPFEHLHHSMSGDGDAEVGAKYNITMPTVAMTILSGGKSAPGKLNLFKNVFLISSPATNIRDSISKLTAIYQNAGRPASAKGALLNTGAYGGYQASYDKLEQPLDAILEAINTSGHVPGQDVFVGVECAAHELFDYEKGKYEIINGLMKTADDMLEVYRDLLARYPAVIMLIDPLRKEDQEQWPKLCELVSEKCFVIGGEAIYGSMKKFDSNSLSTRPSSGVAISNGGMVTCSDMHRVVRDVRANSGVTILTSLSDDVCDDVFSDLAVGLEIDVIKLGAPSRGEHLDRINRLLEIEEFIEEDDKLQINYREAFSFPNIKPPPPPEVVDEEGADPTVASTPDQKTKKK